MSSTPVQVDQPKSYWIYGVAIVVSCFLTWISILQYRTFNADGVLYLQTARDFLQSGLHAAYHQYPWPFFSIFIAKLSSWSGASVLMTAYWMSGFFFALIAAAFVAIVRQLDFSPRLQWFALFVILTFRPLTKYSHYIIRDTGYIAFLLLSVALLIAFMRKPRWYKAFAWNISLVIATLFRVEGVLFLALVPFIAWLDFSETCLTRLWRYIQLNLLSAVYLVGVIAFVCFLSNHGIYSTGRLRGLLMGIGGFVDIAHMHFSHAVSQVIASILPPPAARFAGTFVFSGLLGTFIYCCVIGVTLPYLVGILFGLRGIVWRRYKEVLAYCAVAFILVLAYSFWRYYFVVRYFVPLSLLLLTIAIPGLVRLYQVRQHDRCRYFPWRKILLVIVGLLIIGQVASTLFHIGPSKRYRYLAGKWVEHHTRPQATIYTNDGKIAFISNRSSKGWRCKYLNGYKSPSCFDFSKLASLPWKGSDYLVLSLNNSAQVAQVTQLIKHQPLKAYQGRHDKQVVIYRLQPL